MDLNNEWEMFNENPEMELDYKSEHDSLSVSLYPGSHDNIGSEIHQVLYFLKPYVYVTNKRSLK